MNWVCAAIRRQSVNLQCLCLDSFEFYSKICIVKSLAKQSNFFFFGLLAGKNALLYIKLMIDQLTTWIFFCNMHEKTTTTSCYFIKTIKLVYVSFNFIYTSINKYLPLNFLCFIDCYTNFSIINWQMMCAEKKKFSLFRQFNEIKLD